MEISFLIGITKIAFLLNLLNREKLERWACKMIQKGYTNDLYLDLATSKNDRDVLDALGGNPIDKRTTELLLSYFFGYFRDSLDNKNWKTIVGKMVAIKRIIDLSVVDEFIVLFLTRTKDDFELRNEGFRGSMDMPLELIEFLDQFADFPTLQSKLEKIAFPKLEID